MARQRTLETKGNRDKFLEAYREKDATIESAAEAVGLSRYAYYDYLKHNPDPAFVERLNEIKAENKREREACIVEDAVKGLGELVKDRVPSAIYFALKTRGGWHEKQEVEVSVKDYKVDFGE